jgi:hypothetical protein
MTITQLAERYRLRVRKDECGNKIIPGKVGQIYHYGNGGMGLIYMPDPQGHKPPSVGKWNNRRKAMVAAGFRILQDGDAEGSAIFDGNDPKQVRLAIQIVRAKTIRAVSDAQRTALAIARSGIRLKSRQPLRSDTLAAQDAPGGRG